MVVEVILKVMSDLFLDIIYEFGGIFRIIINVDDFWKVSICV